MGRSGEEIVDRKSAIAEAGGFTLIELLVVIAIISVLMAALLPVLHRVRKQAKAIVCQSNLRQWGMVLATYTEDHQGRFPSTVFNSGIDSVWLLRGAFLSGKDANEPQDSFHHFHTQKITCCPMATKPARWYEFGFSGTKNSFGSPYEVRGRQGSAFGSWQITTPAPTFCGSYGLNVWLFQGFRVGVGDPILSRDLQIVLDVLSLQGRSGIPVLLDATYPWSWSYDTDSPPTDPVYGHPGIGYHCTIRHQDSLNGLFLDWSVRKVGLKELWTLKWSKDFDRAGSWTKAGGVQPEDWPAWMRKFKDY
jgi:prepilin-type N-terminal cleavage/methylation domain-containing protein